MKTSPLSILIVDDEPKAVDYLAMLVNEIDGAYLAGTANNADEALKLLCKKTPDLILLDIQMPEKSGFDLISELKIKKINVGYIFVTAFDEYAIKAIKASAFDYLLKPVDRDELTESIARFRYHFSSENINDHIENLLTVVANRTKIKVETRSGYIILNPHEILYCLADGNYTDAIMADGRKETLTLNLSRFHEKLTQDCFFRVSRSALINLNYLTGVDEKARKCKFSVRTSDELKVSRSRLKDLKQWCEEYSSSW